MAKTKKAKFINNKSTKPKKSPNEKASTLIEIMKTIQNELERKRNKYKQVKQDILDLMDLEWDENAEELIRSLMKNYED